MTTRHGIIRPKDQVQCMDEPNTLWTVDYISSGQAMLVRQNKLAEWTWRKVPIDSLDKCDPTQCGR
jgi:hypothetical protein